MLSSKSKQTYTEVLKAICDDSARPIVYLSDISKRYYTAELLSVALMHHRAKLSEIPREAYTYNLCYIAAGHDPDAIGYIPDEYIDKEMAVRAVSCNNKSLAPALHRFRVSEGREDKPYNNDDLSLMLIAACPVSEAKTHLNCLSDSKAELNGRSIEHYASDTFGSARFIPARIVAEGLRRILSENTEHNI